MIGFDHSDTLLIGSFSDTSIFRDAVEFKPILVLDGQRVVEGSAGWGVQPRSAIGQTDGGEVLLLIVDGRAPGYSIGATMQEIAELMLDYNVYQAINLDGGSSSIMYYNGRIITKPSAGDKKNGRLLPNGFIVRPSN
jgi:exopolysaccharide biosynthesis protein